MSARRGAGVLGLLLALGAAAAGGLRTDGKARLYRELAEVPCRPGRPVVLVFFTTACPTCWDDLFESRSIIEANGLELELVGVTRDPEPAVRAFLAKYGFPGPVVRDAGKRLYRVYKIEAEPFTVAIDGGRVLYRDDDYQDFKTRRENLKQWMLLHFGRSTSVSAGTNSGAPGSRGRPARF